MLEGASGRPSARLAGGSQSVRSSGEAGNDRGAKGRRKMAVRRSERRKRKPTRVPARASQWWSPPSASGLVDTERRTGELGDEAKSRSLSTEHPLTGEPDAGDPPVRFGGGARFNPLSRPLSRKSSQHATKLGESMAKQRFFPPIWQWRQPGGIAIQGLTRSVFLHFLRLFAAIKFSRPG